MSAIVYGANELFVRPAYAYCPSELPTVPIAALPAMMPADAISPSDSTYFLRNEKRMPLIADGCDVRFCEERDPPAFIAV